MRKSTELNEIIKVQNGELEEVEVVHTPSIQEREYFEIIAGSTGSVQLGMCVHVGLHIAKLVHQPTNAAFKAFCLKVQEQRKVKRQWVVKVSNVLAKNAAVFNFME